MPEMPHGDPIVISPTMAAVQQTMNYLDFLIGRYGCQCKLEDVADLEYKRLGDIAMRHLEQLMEGMDATLGRD